MLKARYTRCSSGRDDRSRGSCLQVIDGADWSRVLVVGLCTWWVVKKKHIDRQILGRSIRIVRERWRWSRSCLRARQGKSAMTCRFEVDSLAPSPCGGSWWQLLFGGIDQCKLSLGIRLHRTCPWIWSSNNNVWAAGSRFLNSPYQTGSTTPPALFFLS